jgi:hypothetical protein
VRLSDLLGAPVSTADGDDLGAVQDVRLVQDGPYVDGFGQALRVEGIVTGRGSLAVRLGFARAGVTGPWPLTTIFRRLERRARYYEWDEVDTWDDEGVRLRPGATATEPLG